jgi:hypothetical protein
MKDVKNADVLSLLGLVFVGFAAGSMTYRLNSHCKPMRPSKSLVAAGVGSAVGAALFGKAGLAAGASP